MKKITMFFLLLCFSTSFSQKELWSVFNGANTLGFGTIVKFDITGENPEIMHEFVFPEGAQPIGKLFQASNGKLYGVTFRGGSTSVLSPDGTGAFFEYDPIFNNYSVIHYFDFSNGGTYVPIFPGVIEPIAGKLVGMDGKRPFSYDLASGIFTVSALTNQTEHFPAGELMKASDGFMYGTTYESGTCPTNSPLNSNKGSIFKINPLTLLVQTVYRFKCDGTDGVAPLGGLVEANPNLLYGVTAGGGDMSSNFGTLFEFNTATHIFVKKIVFDGPNLGEFPLPLLDDGNGKLYGLCRLGGTAVNSAGAIRHDGTLFEYFPSTNILTKLIDLKNEVFPDFGIGAPSSLLKTSDGTYVGLYKIALSEHRGFPWVYDPQGNTARVTGFTADFINHYNKTPSSPFIEICRKPSYHFFDVSTFTVCVDDPFTFDIQNTNATSYLWKKGNTPLPAQTTAILNIASVSLSDEGSYTCEMTNECGTTLTMPFQLIAESCLGLDEVIGINNAITIYPNPVKNILNLQLSGKQNIKLQKVSIINMLGQTIHETENSTTVDISFLNTGIYQLCLKTENGYWFGKFLKE